LEALRLLREHWLAPLASQIPLVVAVCHLRMLTQMLHALVRMLHARLVLEVIADVDRSCCYFISTWPEAESKYVCLIGARAPSQWNCWAHLCPI